ncbi:hypothetical protein ABKA04_003897 [Annulohypoxylon sp. FPYF3050]
MLLIALLFNVVIATDHGNVSLLDDAALFDQPNEVYNPNVGPRYFINGMLPIPALWPPVKAKRQTPRQCTAGYHGCLEVAQSIRRAQQQLPKRRAWYPGVVDDLATLPRSSVSRPLADSVVPAPTLVTPAPSGCTTSQITCEIGGGCCNFGSTCTSSVLPTTTLQQCAVNLTVVDTGGLSEGARVGIGVGVAVGAAVVIGAVTWFWITRRRKAKSAHQGDGFSDDQQMDNFREPYVPRNGAYSDSLSPSSGFGGRPMLHETGLTYAYNGPDAVRGPYTDSTAAATELRSSPGISDRGAAVANRVPEDPGDIYRSVELDAQEEAPRAELTQDAVIDEKDAALNGKPPVEHHLGPFELVGSPGPSPPPMSREETEQQRAQATSPSTQEANEQERKEAKK